MCLIPGLGRSSGGGRGNPLQYSHLENPMNRGAWQAMGLYGRKESGMSEATQHNNNNYRNITSFMIYLDQYPLNVANNNI